MEMEMFSLNLDYAKPLVEEDLFYQKLELAHKKNEELESGKGLGSEMLGWLELPSNYPEATLFRIHNEVRRLKEIAEYLVVIGIGGSYLGAKATIEALKPFFSTSPVIFAGFNLSENYLHELTHYLSDKDYALCVVSKSGTTLEPAVAFRVLREQIYKKYGNKAKDRIVAITNPHKGALLELAKKEGYTIFEIPDDIGGRYSILTPAGLFPIAFAGYDINLLIDGARVMQIHSSAENPNNLAELYAAMRNTLYEKGYQIELITTYSAELAYFQKWWQQLFGESEGKEGKGIYPAIAQFTTDLHSIGQYIQQGSRILFETVIFNKAKPLVIEIDEDPNNFDGLNYLAGKTIQDINEKAFLGTLKAHFEGGIPNLVIELPGINEFILGQLFYFFERACAISGYMIGVNPFDQPGVEAYKKNMFELLGKPK